MGPEDHEARASRTFTEAYFEMCRRDQSTKKKSGLFMDTTRQRTLQSFLPHPTSGNQQQNDLRESHDDLASITTVPPSAPNLMSMDNDGMDTESPECVDEVVKELNKCAQVLFPPDPIAPGADRWILEPEFLRAYLAVWTLEQGLEILHGIHQVLQELECTRPPDLSLQWIGRKLWGLTIQLPRLRSGGLSTETLRISTRIDEAIAEILRPRTTSVQEARVTKEEEVPEMDLDENRCPLSLKEDKTHDSNQLNDDGNDDPLEEAAVVVDHIERLEEGHTGPQHPDPRRNLTFEAPAKEEKDLHLPLSKEKEIVTVKIPHAASTVRSSFSVLSSTMRNQNQNQNSISACAIQSDSPSSHGQGTRNPNPTCMIMNAYEDPFKRCVPQKTGWLKKKSGHTSWHTRWFELKGNRLYYFATEQAGIPKGAIVLDRVHISSDEVDSSVIKITASTLENDDRRGGHRRGHRRNEVCVMKFSNRLTHQSQSRRSYLLRAETKTEALAWIELMTRVSLHSSRRMSLPHLRTIDERHQCHKQHPHGSIRYLRATDPLLWNINPIDQLAIAKKASTLHSKSDVLVILSKYAHVFRKLELPPPRPISMEQILRDLEPESFVVNDVLYDKRSSSSLDHLFQVLESYVGRFTSGHDERINCVSAILHASARTIGGGDAYLVLRSLLLGGSSVSEASSKSTSKSSLTSSNKSSDSNRRLLLKPSQVHASDPIVIQVSPETPSEISVTITSVFAFHQLKEDGQEPESGSMVQLTTLHVQKFDFAIGKCRRWVSIKETDDGQRKSSGGVESSSSG